MENIHISFTDDNFISDPYPYYADWRRQAQYFYDPEWNSWFFLNFNDISSLLRDRRLGRSIDPSPETPLSVEFNKPENRAVRLYHQDSLMDKEPPDHTRLKGLVQQVFTPHRVESLRTRIREIALSLLEKKGGKTEFDLLADYAEPLPVLVISELLGVPVGDWRLLRKWSNTIVRVYELDCTSDEIHSATLATQEFNDYLMGVISQKARIPGDDLLSSLVRLQRQTGQLSEPELLSTCILLLNAGHEATVNVLGNGMLALLKHPEQLQLLRKGQESIRNAVEEMLRYDTPLQFFHRWVLEDMEFNGRVFARGERMGLLFGAGNRDPVKFFNADEFNITRQENTHLSFGGGIHFCLGAPLARLELYETLQVLLQQFKSIELTGPDPCFRDSFVIRGLKDLKVTVARM